VFRRLFELQEKQKKIMSDRSNELLIPYISLVAKKCSYLKNELQVKVEYEVFQVSAMVSTNEHIIRCTN
jgi:hypothetical protein